jgi:transposase InsO family protein
MRVIYPDRGLACLCQLLGYSRQAYYKVKKNSEDKAAFYSIVADLVTEVRTEIGNFKLGARKLLPLINEKLDKSAQTIGRDQLFEVMELHGLKVRKRKRRRPSTTNSEHDFGVYPNLIKHLDLQEAERVWASDITYIKVKDRFLYLNLITDCYSRKIMGYCLHPDLSAEGTLKALMMALGNRQYPSRKLIHHSDRGIQYCSQVYVNMLKTHGISISMAAKGSPQENPLAERVNGILKDEYDLGKPLDNDVKALLKVENSIGSYNMKRPHNSLEGDTPEQKHNEDIWKQDLDTSRSTQIRTKQTNVNAAQDKVESRQVISGQSLTKTTQ